mmetsp:Transcript_12876/g.22247  ORF Transcript_12876/g.22247 Transcript_12876/m.22247 type:complete len:279 (-) Transcript_12876:399-1235(-)
MHGCITHTNSTDTPSASCFTRPRTMAKRNRPTQTSRTHIRKRQHRRCGKLHTHTESKGPRCREGSKGRRRDGKYPFLSCGHGGDTRNTPTSHTCTDANANAETRTPTRPRRKMERGGMKTDGRDAGRRRCWAVWGWGHLAMISFSLSASSLSISLMYLSVSFWILSSSSFARSFDRSPDFSFFLTPSMASLLTLRSATLPCSASFEHCFASSLRRSVVRGGMERRMIFPSLFGLRPRSDICIAFSMACTAPLSNGVTTIVLASGVEMEAICFRGVSAP